MRIFCIQLAMPCMLCEELRGNFDISIVMVLAHLKIDPFLLRGK